MQTLLLCDSDSETEDLIMEQLIHDEQDAKAELEEAKANGPFHLNSVSDKWCIDQCRSVHKTCTHHSLDC